MENLEYRIGKLQINPQRLRLFHRLRSSSCDSGHKFVVEALDNVISIYVAEIVTEDPSDTGPRDGAKRYSHKSVAENFGIPRERIVGGGHCYLQNPDERRFELDDPHRINLDDKNIFFLGDFSRDYKAIPKVVAQRFVELILPELQRLGIKVKETFAAPTEELYGNWNVNSYWRNHGFGPKNESF